MPKDAFISNKQLGEAKRIRKKLEEEPHFSLNQEQKNLIKRAEKHEGLKKKFDQVNPNLDREEL